VGAVGLSGDCGTDSGNGPAPRNFPKAVPEGGGADRESLLRKYGQPPLLAPGTIFSPLVKVKGEGKGLYWAPFLIPGDAQPEALRVEVPVGRKPVINLKGCLKKVKV